MWGDARQMLTRRAPSAVDADARCRKRAVMYVGGGRGSGSGMRHAVGDVADKWHQTQRRTDMKGVGLVVWVKYSLFYQDDVARRHFACIGSCRNPEVRNSCRLSLVS